MIRPFVEECLIEILGAGPLEFEELLARFPKADRNRVILAIDGLSRRGVVFVQPLHRHSYRIGIGQLLAAARSLETAPVADSKVSSMGMAVQQGLGAQAGMPIGKSIE